MEQSSDFIEEEATDEMTITEVIRMNAWLKAMGMSDAQVLSCQNYIATGVGLPTEEPTKEETT